MNWKKREELNKSGLILALCQDNTGIYNQLMFVSHFQNGKQDFYENGTLGSSVRVWPEKIKAGVYLDEICPDEVIDKFCDKSDFKEGK